MSYIIYPAKDSAAGIAIAAEEAKYTKYMEDVCSSVPGTTMQDKLENLRRDYVNRTYKTTYSDIISARRASNTAICTFPPIVEFLSSPCVINKWVCTVDGALHGPFNTSEDALLHIHDRTREVFNLPIVALRWQAGAKPDMGYIG
jgi:hypothetical protein